MWINSVGLRMKWRDRENHHSLSPQINRYLNLCENPVQRLAIKTWLIDGDSTSWIYMKDRDHKTCQNIVAVMTSDGYIPVSRRRDIRYYLGLCRNSTQHEALRKWYENGETYSYLDDMNYWAVDRIIMLAHKYLP